MEVKTFQDAGDYDGFPGQSKHNRDFLSGA